MNLLGRLFILPVGLLASLPSASAIADAAKPRPVLMLEYTSPMHVQTPEGSVLFAVFDDGLVIAQGRKVPVYGKIESTEAERLRQQTVQDLALVSGRQPPNPDIMDDGIATLYVWTGQTYSQYTSSAAACGSGKEPATDDLAHGFWQQARAHTDSRLLKVCDRLSQYEIASPQPWSTVTRELARQAFLAPLNGN